MPRKKSINPVFQKAIKFLADNPTDPNNMDDSQIQGTEVFTVFKELLPTADNYKHLMLAREFIREAWEESKTNNVKKKITKVFSKMADSVTSFTLKRDGDTDVFLISDAALIEVFKLLPLSEHTSEVTLHRNGEYSFSRSRRYRFSHNDYSKLIGQGSSKDVQDEMAQLFEDRGKGAPDFKGGFLIAKQQCRNSSRDGVYELVISKGDKNNERCSTFSAKLYQYPFDSDSAYTVSFPPASGQKDHLTITDDLHEVSGMFLVMKDSLLRGAQTPAVVFGLVEKIREMKEKRVLKLPKGTVAFG